MSTFAAQLTALLRDERGVTAIEYGFIALLVSLTIIAGATQMGQSVKASSRPLCRASIRRPPVGLRKPGSIPPPP